MSVGLRAAYLASTDDFLPSVPTPGAAAVGAGVARAACRRRLVSSSSASSFSLVTSRLVLVTRSFSADSTSCRGLEISGGGGRGVHAHELHEEDSLAVHKTLIKGGCFALAVVTF